LRVVLIIMLLILVSPGAAALEGYIEADYNFLDEQSRNHLTRAILTLELWEDFGQWRIGGKYSARLSRLSWKGFVPSGVPIAQYYEGYIGYLIGKAKISLSSWCEHWFKQSGSAGIGQDTRGLNIRFRYNF